MGQLEYYGLVCNFCDFQSSHGVGFMAPKGEVRRIYRCPDCGTVLCSKCIDREHHFTPVGSTAKLGLAAVTLGASLLFTGVRKEQLKCLKCGSGRIRDVT